MKKWVLAGLGMLASTGAAGADAFADWKTKIDAALAPQLARHAQLGVVVGVLDHERREFWSYGEAGPGRPAKPESVYEIGSITKTFTGLALSALTERGTVALDDKVEKFVTELQGTSAGARTLRELSTHTAGLPRIPADIAQPPFDAADPFRQYGVDRALAWLKAQTFTPVPTFEDRNYSNLGVSLLGLALTRATGSPTYEAMLRQNVLAPLHLETITLSPTPDQLAAAALPHDDTTQAVSPWHLSEFWQPAGALHASARDLLEYAHANLHPPTRALVTAFALAHSVQAHGSARDIGLGWMLEPDKIWHSGETGGFLTWIEFHPSLDRAVVVLSNITLPAQCVADAVFDRPCQVGLGVQLDESERKALVGSYRYPSEVRLEVRDAGDFLIGEVFANTKSLGHFRMWGGSKTDFFDAQHTVNVHFNEQDGSALLSINGQSAVGFKKPAVKKR